MHTRREFLKMSGVGLTAATLLSAGENRDQRAPLDAEARTFAGSVKLGLASYTVRKFTLDQVLAMVGRLGLTRVALKDVHLPFTASAQELGKAVAQARAKGIEIYGCGTIYMKTPEEVARSFRYAQAAGFKLIICAPNLDLLPLVEQQVKATGILVAIHNHGPDNPLYPSPLDAYEAVKNMDRRMGVCMDIGHTRRLGQDPATVFGRVFDRLYDVHIKDVSAATAAGRTVEIGRGVIDMVAFLRAVVSLRYAYTLNFEHEKDDNDPLPGVAESVGHVRGMLKMMSV